MFPSEKLEMYLKERRFKKKDLFEQLQIDKSTFCRKLKNESEFTYNELRKLKNFMELTDKEFLELWH